MPLKDLDNTGLKPKLEWVHVLLHEEKGKDEGRWRGPVAL